MFDVEELNLKKLNDAEIKEKSQAKVSNSSAALENFFFFLFFPYAFFRRRNFFLLMDPLDIW